MNLRKASPAGAPSWLPGLFFVIATSLSTLGADCGTVVPGATPPAITIRLNGIPDDMDNLLVLATSGFVVDVSWQAGTFPVDPATQAFSVRRWSVVDEQTHAFTLPAKANGSGAIGTFADVLEPGTYTLRAVVRDVQGNASFSEIAFAVRSFGGAAPIGTGQQIWLDFDSDRDAVPGPDFAVDLQFFGLASPSAPLVSSWVEDAVIAGVVARVEEAYHDHPTNGLPGPDPVAVEFSATNPGAGDVTQVCIGGEDPSGGITIGAILTDTNNANRSTIECATLPPTGIFPRELLILAGDPDFQAAFDGLRSATGGVPVGEHPLDTTVLAPGFDLATASPGELARFAQVLTAADVFSDMLGSIIAHEAGHALGLVPPGPPGGGLFGGTSGATLNHDVTTSGANPTENFIMNAGNTFTTARLAGLNGNPLPYFRAIDYAYLRDRVVVDPAVNVLAYPPSATSITPNVISAPNNTQVYVNGTGYLPTPSIRMLKPGYTYNVVGETLLSSSQVRGWVNHSQILPGVYDVELRNPDGQIALLPGALTVTQL
jgi:hypothetical protein